MPRVVYVGPFDQVDVPALRVGGVKPGDAIEVSEADAENLLAQVGNWAAPGSPEAKEAEGRAAATAKRIADEEAAAKAAAAKAAPAKSKPALAGQEG